MRIEREGIGNTVIKSCQTYIRHTHTYNTYTYIYRQTDRQTYRQTDRQTDRQTAVMGSSTEFSASSTSTIRHASALYQPLAKVPLEHKVKHFQTLQALQHNHSCAKHIRNRVALWNVRPFKAGFL